MKIHLHRLCLLLSPPLYCGALLLRYLAGESFSRNYGWVLLGHRLEGVFAFQLFPLLLSLLAVLFPLLFWAVGRSYEQEGRDPLWLRCALYLPFPLTLLFLSPPLLPTGLSQLEHSSAAGFSAGLPAALGGLFLLGTALKKRFSRPRPGRKPSRLLPHLCRSILLAAPVLLLPYAAFLQEVRVNMGRFFTYVFFGKPVDDPALIPVIPLLLLLPSALALFSFLLAGGYCERRAVDPLWLRLLLYLPFPLLCIPVFFPFSFRNPLFSQLNLLLGQVSFGSVTVAAGAVASLFWAVTAVGKALRALQKQKSSG